MKNYTVFVTATRHTHYERTFEADSPEHARALADEVMDEDYVESFGEIDEETSSIVITGVEETAVSV